MAAAARGALGRAGRPRRRADEDEEDDGDEGDADELWGDDDEGGPEYSGDGYTTGAATSGDEQDGADYFAHGTDVHALLQVMAAPQPGNNEPQPFEILRHQRAVQAAEAAAAPRPRRKAVSAARARTAGVAAAAAAAAGGDSSGSDYSADEDELQETEGLDDADMVELGLAREPKRKRKYKTRAGGGGGARHAMELPEHISRMVGHANLLYASNKYQEAVKLLLEVIRSVPNLADPYRTLGALHEVLGQPRQALNFYIIAAHMGGRSNKDVALWQKLAEMSEQQGFVRQAMYCWNKVLVRAKDDFDARFARARLYADVGEPWRARSQLNALLERHPGHPEVVRSLAMLHHHLGELPRAVALLEAQLAAHYHQADLTHVNMLTDLYMSLGCHQAAVQLICRCQDVMCEGKQLPLDLRARRGACYVAIGQALMATPDLNAVLDTPLAGAPQQQQQQQGGQAQDEQQQEEEQEDYSDLYVLIVQEVTRAGRPDLALPFLDALRDVPAASAEPQQWRQLADSYVAAGQPGAARALAASRMALLPQSDERYLNCALHLARLHLAAGDAASASALLQQLDADLEARRLTLPEGRARQLSLFLDKCSLHLALGQREAFASGLLPHITGLLDTAETNSAVLEAASKAASSGVVHKDLLKALRRHRMFERRGGRKGEGGYEADSVFRGYETKDRRAPRVQAIDALAEQLLQRAAAEQAAGAESEPEDEGRAAGAGGAGGAGGGDLPAELRSLAAAVIAADRGDVPDLFGNPQLYGAFVDLVQVLGELGQEQQAGSLVTRVQSLATALSKSRDLAWMVAPSMAKPGPGRRPRVQRRPGAGSASEMSDWEAPGGRQGQQADTASAAEQRTRMRQLQQGLQLMHAEVALRQGRSEEALRQLKLLLPKWPYSWRVWSAYCCCCSSMQSRTQHWRKLVDALRAKHPDSLPLQVLAAHADNLGGEQQAACQAYAAALQHLPREPLLLLCLGCALIDCAVARTAQDRNATLLRGFAALHTYARLRGPHAEAEAAYNLGRAAHTAGLLHVAVAHYERVLQLADDEADAADAADAAAAQLSGMSLQPQQEQPQQGQKDQHDQELGAEGEPAREAAARRPQARPPESALQQLGRGLAREAAHNLALIYRGSGADDLARAVMTRYLTV